MAKKGEDRGVKQQRRRRGRGRNAKAAGYPVGGNGQPEGSSTGSSEKAAISRGISPICLTDEREGREGAGVDMFSFVWPPSWMGKREGKAERPGSLKTQTGQMTA